MAYSFLVALMGFAVIGGARYSSSRRAKRSAVGPGRKEAMKTRLEVADDQGVLFDLQGGIQSGRIDGGQRHTTTPVVVVEIAWYRSSSAKQVTLTVPEARELARQLLAHADDVDRAKEK